MMIVRSSTVSDIRPRFRPENVPESMFRMINTMNAYAGGAARPLGGGENGGSPGGAPHWAAVYEMLAILARSDMPAAEAVDGMLLPTFAERLLAGMSRGPHRVLPFLGGTSRLQRREPMRVALASPGAAHPKTRKHQVCAGNVQIAVIKKVYIQV